MRILCLATDAYGGHGGIAQACRDILWAFAEVDDVESIEVLPRRGPAKPGGLPRKISQKAPRGGRIAYALAALAAARQRPSVVFCGHLYMAPLAAAVAATAGAKLIIHLHGIEVWRPPTALQRHALEIADALWCVSRDTRARVLRHTRVIPERAIVVSNTFAPEFRPGDRSVARAVFGLTDEFVMLTVSRLDSHEQYKGQDRIIRLLPQLKRRYARIKFLIAGDGDDRPRLAALTRQTEVEDCVQFLGAVSPAKLPDLYRAADLFVLPSSGEGFGIAFVEAMACGTPALGLAIAGAKDALGDGELGHCVTESELGVALAALIDRPPPDWECLSANVEGRFGRARLAAAVAGYLARLNDDRGRRWAA